MKIKKRILLFAAAILFVAYLYFAASWVITECETWFTTLGLPQPQETYGEFPFKLTYEIKGTQYTVEDVYICEYTGTRWNINQGKFRVWNGYIKGTGNDSVILYEDSERTIYCFVGDAEFYMNDEKYPEQRPLTPRIYSVLNRDPYDHYVKDRFDNIDELTDYYDIQIIDWFFSEPIENSFK